jgi:hypothetical protein
MKSMDQLEQLPGVRRLGFDWCLTCEQNGALELLKGSASSHRAPSGANPPYSRELLLIEKRKG